VDRLNAYGPSVWESVQALRAVDGQLQLIAKKYDGRDALICVHGNRFIQWAVLRAFGMKTGDAFANVTDAVPSIVEATVVKVVTSVRTDYGDSYPASLFKNLAKCRALANKII
jgi:hypothetical protein